MGSTQRSWPDFKKSGRNTIGQRVLHDTLKNARRTNIAMLEESIGWTYNAILTGLMVLAKDDYWLVIIKASFQTGPMVAFIECGDYGRACEVAVELADTRGLIWKKDKRPPWTRNKRRREGYVNPRGGAAVGLDLTPIED